MSDFGNQRSPVARKPHRCEACFETIEKGEKHVHYTGVWQGEWQNWRMHDECHELYTSDSDYYEDGFESGSFERPVRLA